MPPGPRTLPALQLYGWLRDPHALLDRSARDLGATFTLDLPLLSRATVVVSSPDLVRDVFVAPPDVLSAGEASAVFEPFVGLGSLFLLDGAAHARHRRLMGAAFRKERVDAHFGDIVDAVDRVASAWPSATSFRFYDAASAIALEVLVRSVFGPRGTEALDAFGRRARQMVDICAKPHLLLAAARVDLGPWSPWGRVLRRMRELDARIVEHVTARRAVDPEDRARVDPEDRAVDPEDRAPVAPGRDVLGMLLAARDEGGAPLTDSELRDELVTLLVAGSETTAGALAWTLDELLRAPAELEKVRDELRAVLGGEALRPEHVPKLVQLDACVRESLRLHPPITNAIRVVKKPFRLGPWELPPGSEVAPCMHLTHRRADLYPEPLAYRPERFVGKKIDPYAYFPFGGGGRRCLGMNLALYEITVTLARVLSRYALRLATGERPRARRRALLMAPSTGVPVVAERLRGVG